MVRVFELLNTGQVREEFGELSRPAHDAILYLMLIAVSPELMVQITSTTRPKAGRTALNPIAASIRERYPFKFRVS